MTGVSTSCGACKFLRRKCTSECVFAPYFSYDEAASHFSAVHKVFGASNFSRLLLRLPQQHRSQAAISVSYEALARMRDPVYGCVAYIFALQQEVANLQEEIEVLGSHMNLANLNPSDNWVASHNNCGSCQASNNFINNNNVNNNYHSSLLEESPMNLLEHWRRSTTYQQQEQVVPTTYHAETNANGGYNYDSVSSNQSTNYTLNNNLITLSDQPMPMCEWERSQDDLFRASDGARRSQGISMVEAILNQDVFDAQQWMIN